MLQCRFAFAMPSYPDVTPERPAVARAHSEQFPTFTYFAVLYAIEDQEPDTAYRYARELATEGLRFLARQ